MNALLSDNVLSTVCASLVADFSRQWSISEFDALLETSVVSERDLARNLARILTIPLYEELPSIAIDPEAMSMLPFAHARTLRAMPLSFLDPERSALLVVFADPTCRDTIESVAEFTGCHIQLAVAESSVVRDAIDAHYPASQQLF
jgi:hypothetical protein